MRFVANDNVLTVTLAEARTVAWNRTFWLGLLAVSFVLGLSGPFGTYTSLPIAQRLAYWLLVTASSFWLGYLMSFAAAVLAEDRGAGARASLILGTVVASGPVALWLACVHAVVFDAQVLREAMRLFPYVVAVSLALALVSEAMSQREAGPAKQVQAPQTPEWLDQLPPELGRRLLLLQAQDHYLRAETHHGETLLRGTLKQASDELGNYGVRVHRSWWVARDVISAFEYRNGAPVVVLVDGRTLPVGRTYRRAVIDAIR